MVDYCGACGPKWYGPYNQVLTAEQCNWVPAWQQQIPQPIFPFNAQPAQRMPAQIFNAQPAQRMPAQIFNAQPAQRMPAQVLNAQPAQRMPVQVLNAQPTQRLPAFMPNQLQQSPQQQAPPLTSSAPRCPPPPDCDLDFLNSSNQSSSNEQPTSDTPAQKQEKAWQDQAQQTHCHYENPQMAPNGCVVGCGKLVCDGPVRFLEIAMGQGSAVATWVPPLSAPLGQMYTVDMSYDGNTWRNLPLEQPWATFARFQVDEGKPFQLRVTASGYPSAVKTFDFADVNATSIPQATFVQIGSTESGEASLEIDNSTGLSN